MWTIVVAGVSIENARLVRYDALTARVGLGIRGSFRTT